MLRLTDTPTKECLGMQEKHGTSQKTSENKSRTKLRTCYTFFNLLLQVYIV